MEQKKRAVAPDSWVEIKKKLRHWDQPRLLGLIQDLCDAMPDVRTALASRLNGANATNSASLVKPMKEIRVAIQGRGKLPSYNSNVSEAKKIAARYYKVSGDADGAIMLYAELMGVLVDVSKKMGDLLDPQVNALFHSAEQITKLVAEAQNVELLRSLFSEFTRMGGGDVPGYVSDAAYMAMHGIEKRLEKEVE